VAKFNPAPLSLATIQEAVPPIAKEEKMILYLSGFT
jgi:hypothetical protein